MSKPRRKKPFSGKAKKQQLQTKKQRQSSALLSMYAQYNNERYVLCITYSNKLILCYN